ncbi:MAG: dipeptidase [Anaerolineae bacterium]|nr:dipeptidase [Anaerolineae bacterium]
MTTVFDYTQEQAERFRQELHELLRIPSVSTDPDYAPEVRRAADWLAAHMRNIGLDAEVIATEGHPLVYAEWLNAGEDVPTVLVYGHYDVQPAQKEDGWDSEPFEPVEHDGQIWARGATDDKGQFFTHVKAVEALLKTEGKLPVNVKFLIEGEEESGGAAVSAFVKSHPEKLTADACVISDGGMSRDDQPIITSSVRGISQMELRVSGPKQDIHSGMYGGTVHNPLLALAQIIAQLHNPDGSIAVPGFYDDMLPLSEYERVEIAKNPMTEAEWRAETGAPQPWGEPDYSLQERIGARPTLEITGMAGGYYQAGYKTIVPQNAYAKIICRLVANQQPHDIYEKIRDYVGQITPPTVKSEVIDAAGALAAQMDITGPAMQAAVRAYEKGWGYTPIFQREGGTLPIVADLQSTLNMPVVLMGFGLNSDNLHGPNEHYRIDLFHRGIDTAINFLRECTTL